jgi:hypothetical protein
MYNFLMLNLVVRIETARLQKINKSFVCASLTEISVKTTL